MKLRKILSGLILIFMFAFLINETEAAGVISGLQPGTVFYFKPGQQLRIGFLAFSNTDKVMDHFLSLGGDLAAYATLSTSVIKDLAPGESKSFDVKLKMPQELEPGLHRLYVCVGESMARGSALEGTVIGTKTVACTAVKVFSLYPYPAADFTFSTKNVAVGELANFVLNVESLSLLDMKIRAEIEIYNKADLASRIVTLSTEEKRLKSSEKTQLSATLDTTNFEIGEYLAKATLFFDGKNLTKEASFRIGELSMEVLNWTQKVVKGEVVPIEIYVKSNWNYKIDNVYARLNISKENFSTVLVTPAESFEAWQTKPLTAYWDTKRIETGDYNIKVELYYEDKLTQKEGTIKVITRLKPTTLLLLVLVAVLVTALIVMVIKTKKKEKKWGKAKG